MFVSAAWGQSVGGAANEAGREDSRIDEIIVIGSKTFETRQDLAASLGYFDEDRLINETIFNVEDIFDRTANAFTGIGGFSGYSIRGVNNNGVVGAQNNSNALASIIVGQVAMGVSSGDFVKPSLFDVASVEILRGPQSAVQGPNSLIGAIYINPNTPDMDSYEGRFRAEAGEFGLLNLGLVQNVPLIDDVLAARIVVETLQLNGAVENITTGVDDVTRRDQVNTRLGLRYQPMGSDDLVFDLTYTYANTDSNPFGSVAPPPGGRPRPRAASARPSSSAHGAPTRPA